MRQSIRLGRLHGIPVGMHWSVLLILGLLTQLLAAVVLPAAAGGYAPVGYWLAGAGFAALFLGGLLAHEYAHARVAQHYGIPVRSITLWMLGGVSELGGEPPRPRAQLLIALAGPAASLAAGAVFVGLAVPARATGAALLAAGCSWLALVNVALAVFNALPGTPLDGGRVLEAIIWRMRGDRFAARRAAARAGIAVGLVVAFAGLFLVLALSTLTGLWLLLVGWYLTSVARTEHSALGLLDRLGDLRVGRLMSAPAVCGYAGQTVSSFIAEVAEAHPHHRYPVVDLDGRLSGLVLAGALARIPPAERRRTRLAEVMVPAARLRTAQRGTPLSDPSTIPVEPFRVTVVLDGQRPCGVLTPGDLSRALVVAAAGGRPDRSRGEHDRPWLSLG